MYHDVEYKLAQYAQWCGNPLRTLGYPKSSSYARDLTDALDDGRLPDMTDEEAQAVGEALAALKRFNKQAYDAVWARFFQNLADGEIARRDKRSRARVHDLRMRAYWFLAGRLMVNP